MFFLTPNQGWINIQTGSAVAHPGALFMTQDAGATWNWAGSASSGPLTFTTANDGWIVAPDGDDLYVTHDGSRTWQEVTLPSPPGLNIAPNTITRTIYDLPAFSDSNHGLMQAAYVTVSRRSLVFFATSDGGRSWNVSKVMLNVGELASMVANSEWIAASVSEDRSTIALTNVPLSALGKQPESATWKTGKLRTEIHNIGLPTASNGEISFIDSRRGWMMAGHLLSTTNGGASWTVVTPPKLLPPPTTPAKAGKGTHGDF